MSTLVTGDAVVLELPPAGLATRLVGILVDAAIYVGAAIAISVGLAPLLTLDPATSGAIGLSVVVGCLVVAPTAVEAASRGRSVGKLVMGLRVVRDDGGSIRTRQAFTRQLVGFVEIYVTFGIITVIAVLWNSRAKRLGDMLAGTYVVSERTPLVGSPMAAMPPELAGWAATADLGRIPGSLALAGRTFLARAATMTPSARTETGSRLRDEFAGFVAPPPPSGTPPERFVAAVLAERRRRDLERLAAERAQLDRLRELTARRRERV